MKQSGKSIAAPDVPAEQRLEYQRIKNRIGSNLTGFSIVLYTKIAAFVYDCGFTVYNPADGIPMPFRTQNENLFEDSRMSFGEHLEELRKVLIRSLVGIAAGCVIGFWAAERVVEILQRPLENALTKFYVDQGKRNLRAERGFVPPEFSELLDNEQKIPETVLIDPGQLVAGLRSVSPDFLESVSLKPYRFSTTNFDPTRIPEMCRDWSNRQTANKLANQQWAFLWNLVSESDQHRIVSISTAKQASNDDVRFLADVMNGLLVHEEIHQSEIFASMITHSDHGISDFLAASKPNPLIEMKQQLAERDDADLSQRINRLLLSRLAGPAISDLQMDMIPITIWKSARYTSQSLGATETFMIWVKAGVVSGLVIASPWVFFQIWSFVAAGLYPTEQKYVYVFLPISLLLFFAGALLAFFFVFEPVLDFLFSFNARMGIAPHPRINDWLSFVLFLPLGFGVAFQLPLVMLFVNRLGLISLEAYTAKWRIAVVAIFALSMILTPADPISMILLAVPLTGLYFLGILMCRWLNKPVNPFAAAAAV